MIHFVAEMKERRGFLNGRRQRADAESEAREIVARLRSITSVVIQTSTGYESPNSASFSFLDSGLPLVR